MKIYDIDSLKKDEFGNYDLSQITFKLVLSGEIRYSYYEVQRGEEMRMDLVCNSIYGNTNYIDILCNVNNIDNPLNIKEGSVIIFPINDIDILRNSSSNTIDINKVLSNTNKASRIDSNRQKYFENNLSLPPTILEESVNQFDIDSQDIILGKGLF